MKTAEGVVEFAAPQVRDTAEPFVSGIRQNLAGRTGALEDLAVELYARGLPTRDIEDAFTDEAGRAYFSACRPAASDPVPRLLPSRSSPSAASPTPPKTTAPTKKRSPTQSATAPAAR